VKIRAPRPRYRVLWRNLGGDLYAHDRSTMMAAIREARSLFASEVAWKDIVKAFEYDKGSYVVLEPGDYVLVETANPSGASVPWLIVIGTTHGAASSWWQEQVRNDLVSIDDASAA